MSIENSDSFTGHEQRSPCFSPAHGTGGGNCQRALEDTAILFGTQSRISANPRTDQVSGTIGDTDFLRFLAPISIAEHLAAETNPVEDALRSFEKTKIIGPKTLRALMRESGERTDGAATSTLAQRVARIDVPDTQEKMDELWRANLLFLQQAKEAHASLEQAKHTMARMRSLCEHLKYSSEAAERLCFPRVPEDIELAVKSRHGTNPVVVKNGGVDFQCSCKSAPEVGSSLVQISAESLPNGEIRCGHTFHTECFSKELVASLSEQDGPAPNVHAECPECRRPFTLSDLHLLRMAEHSGAQKRKKRPHFKWAEKKKVTPPASRRRLAEEFSEDDELETL